MELEAMLTQMKALKAKARAARKAGHDAMALTFQAGSARLRRRAARLPKMVVAVVAAAE